MKHLPAILLLTFGLVACTSEVATSETPEAGQASSAPRVIATPEVHDAICGHVLADVGHCGNYVKIDDEYVVLEWPELGKMEYCGRGEKGAKVEITGEMEDGKFVAKTYKLVE